MWLFFTDAFISIAADPEDPAGLIVLGRKVGDIETMFPNARVIESPDSDYRFSAPVRRRQVAEAIAARIAEIDYPDLNAALGSGTRRDAYLEVWWRMAGWQWEEAIGKPNRCRAGEAALP